MCDKRQPHGVKCGETGFDGRLWLCDACVKTATVKYPQGWRNVPGDVCKHGTYVGDLYGPDFLCGACEDW